MLSPTAYILKIKSKMFYLCLTYKISAVISTMPSQIDYGNAKQKNIVPDWFDELIKCELTKCFVWIRRPSHHYRTTHAVRNHIIYSKSCKRFCCDLFCNVYMTSEMIKCLTHSQDNIILYISLFSKRYLFNEWGTRLEFHETCWRNVPNLQTMSTSWQLNAFSIITGHLQRVISTQLLFSLLWPELAV